MKVIRTIKRLMPVPLTPHEQVEAGIQLARICEDINAEMQLQTDQKAQMKARLTQLESSLTQQRILVRRGAVDRTIDVDLEYYEDGNLIERRRDTCEILITRQATPEERQLSLDDRTEEERGDSAQQEMFPDPAEKAYQEQIDKESGVSAAESAAAEEEDEGEGEDNGLEAHQVLQKCSVCGRDENEVAESAGHFVAAELCSACDEKAKTEKPKRQRKVKRSKI